MRSARTERSNTLFVVLVLAVAAFGAATLGACVIGPKQDDPESSLTDDGGTEVDSSVGTAVDAADLSDTGAPSATPDGGGSADSGPSPPSDCADADACARDGALDGAPEAATDGAPEAAADAALDSAPDALGGD